MPRITPQKLAPMALQYPDVSIQEMTGFSPAIISDVMKHLERGQTLTDCEDLMALPVGTIRRWYDQNYYNFRYAANQAMAKNKSMHIVRAQRNKPDKEELKSSQWWLERKYKDEFSKREEHFVQHNIIDGVARTVVEVLHRRIKDNDLLRDIITDIRQELISQKNPNKQLEQAA